MFPVPWLFPSCAEITISGNAVGCCVVADQDMFADDWWRRNAKEAARSNPIISYIHIPTYIYNYIFDWHKIGSNCRQGLFARGVKILRCPAGRSQWVHHWLNEQMCAISEDKLQQSWSILYRFLHFFTVLSPSLPPSLLTYMYAYYIYRGIYGPAVKVIILVLVSG